MFQIVVEEPVSDLPITVVPDEVLEEIPDIPEEETESLKRPKTRDWISN